MHGTWRRTTTVALGTLLCLAAVTPAARAQEPDLIDSAYAAYYTQRDWAGASVLFDSLTRVNPVYPDYTVRLAFSRFRSGRYQEAIPVFRRAIEIGEWPDIYSYYVASSYAKLGDADSALAWLEKAIDAGWPDYRRLAEDETFGFVRNRPAFQRIFGRGGIDATNRVERWRADLRFIMTKMKLLHYDMYNTNPPEVWDSLYRKIDAAIPRWSDDRIVLGFMKLAALAGEGHTKVLPPESGPTAFHSLPLELYAFKDGFYVLRAVREYRSLVGRKVVAIGSKSVGDLYRDDFVYRGHDNEMHHEKMGPRYLVMTEALRDMGATTRLDRVEVRTEGRDGVPSDQTVRAMTFGALDSIPADRWVPMNAAAAEPPPLYLKNADDDFWFTPVPNAHLMYAHIHYIVNNDAQSFSAFVDSLFAVTDRERLPNLVLDLRNCGGGNSAYDRFLIAALLRHPDVNRAGHLFTIIGRETYSAAINLVTDLEFRTHTTFVGEPTGSSPDFIGESTVLTLPYSGLYLVISNRYHQGGANNSLDARPWIAPNTLVELTSRDYAENRDPVMAEIVRRLQR